MPTSADRIVLYIGRRLRWLTYSYLIVLFIASFTSPHLLMRVLVSSNVRTISPILAPPSSYTTAQHLLMFGFIFALMSVVSAISMTNDLRSSALFHLSQPMSRVDIAISWMILISWAPSILCVLSVVVPLMCYMPHLPGPFLKDLLLLFSQMLITSSIVLVISATRRTWLVLATSLLLVFFLPFLLELLASFPFTSLGYLSELASTALTVLYPMIASMTPSNLPLSLETGSQSALVLAAAIQALYLIYFKLRFEVG